MAPRSILCLLLASACGGPPFEEAFFDGVTDDAGRPTSQAAPVSGPVASSSPSAQAARATDPGAASDAAAPPVPTVATSAATAIVPPDPPVDAVAPDAVPDAGPTGPMTCAPANNRTCLPGCCGNYDGMCHPGNEDTYCAATTELPGVGSQCVSCSAMNLHCMPSDGGYTCGTVIPVPVCNATNCTGCCDSAGICQTGKTQAACGSGGKSCQSCMVLCNAQLCI
jgi:hypothetical protein